MSMMNFAYLSQTKLNQMYPQIPADFRPDMTKYGVEFSLGIVKFKFDSGDKSDLGSDFLKLQKLVTYLGANDEIGTPNSSKPFLYGTIYAHSLMHGNRVFFFGSDSSSEGTINIGFSCSAGNMIGGGYDAPPVSASKQPLGKARATYVPVSSSNASFASSLTRLEMSQSEIAHAERQHHELRRDWLTRFRPTDADIQAIEKRKFVNPLIHVMHHNPLADIQISIIDRFPPPEPGPPLESETLSRPFRWVLGDELYRKKLQALNKAEMYRDADRKTKTHPLTREILGTVLFNATSPTGAAQNYEYVAVRLLDGVLEDKRAILASPLYLAIV